MIFSNNFKRAAAAMATLPLACCIPPSSEPTSAPAPQPTRTTTAVQPPPSVGGPRPTLVPDQTYADWTLAPATSGDWFYMEERDETFALFGIDATMPVAIFRCDKRTRMVGVGRYGAEVTAASLPMRIRTETQSQTVTGTVREGGGTPLIAAEFPANSALLDAMAFSKGRFAIETAGLPTLYLPAWPEITRVMEDCR